MCKHIVHVRRARLHDIVENHHPSMYRDARVLPCVGQNVSCRKTNSHNLDAYSENVSGARDNRNVDNDSPR